MKKSLDFKLVAWFLITTFIISAPGSAHSMDTIRSKAQWAKTKASQMKKKTLDRLIKQYKATRELRHKKTEGTATPAELKELRQRMDTITKVATAIGITLAMIAAIAGGTLAYRAYRKRERRMQAEDAAKAGKAIADTAAQRKAEEEAEQLAQEEGIEAAELIASAKKDTAKQRAMNLDLTVAVEADDIERVRTALQGGAKVNIKLGRVTPLHVTVSKGNKEIAQLLIDNDAQVNAVEDPAINVIGGATPLLKATEANNEEMVGFLISKGANVNLPNRIGHSPLHQAATRGNINIAKNLLDAGAKVDGPSGNWTPLRQAVMWNRVDMAKFLLAKGANPLIAFEDETVADITKNPELQVLLRGAMDERLGTIAQLLQATADPEKLEKSEQRRVPKLPAEMIWQILQEAYPPEKK